MCRLLRRLLDFGRCYMCMLEVGLWGFELRCCRVGLVPLGLGFWLLEVEHCHVRLLLLGLGLWHLEVWCR